MEVVGDTFTWPMQPAAISEAKITGTMIARMVSTLELCYLGQRVHVCQKQASAAVALDTETVKNSFPVLTLCYPFLEGLPEVPQRATAGNASHWN
jgi:hypothetical protein